MPDISNEARASYIKELLFECGLISVNGMGLFPLSWQEIDAWIRVTGRDYLPLYERKLIKHLSGVYVDEYHKAEDPLRVDPFVQINDDRRKRISNHVLDVFKRMKQRQEQSSMKG